MKRVWIGLAFFILLQLGCFWLWFLFHLVSTKEELNEERILYAIYRAEGPKYPYGISSKDEAYNRTICLKTIRHYWQDFKKYEDGSVKDFIVFASRRYVGSNDRIGQERWAKNVRWFYYEKCYTKITKIRKLSGR